ncbi:hypothetical protein Lal_00022586 [Lupinus albus]|nr:hypothetical protein Lal_00022586 [Lupinus albus]
MSLLSKLRCVTVDVTGTLMAYKGELGDYYCMAAKSVGLPCPDYKRMHEAFKLAYKEMATNYPCFGFDAKMPNVVWWKTCVRDSFVRPFLRWLRVKGIKVGIVSNAEYRYRDVILLALGINEANGSAAKAISDLRAMNFNASMTPRKAHFKKIMLNCNPFRTKT